MSTLAVPTQLPPYRFRDEQLARMRSLGMLSDPTNGHPAAIRLTLGQYERLVELGVLTPEDKCELVDGEVVAKMSIGSPHAAAVKRLNRLLTIRAGDRDIVGVQNPLRLPPASEPEPDVLVVASREDFYRTQHPGPDDVYLL